MDEHEQAASSSGLRGRVDTLRAISGLRGQVLRALIPAAALAVVAGGTAGAVTVVSLATTEVTVLDDTPEPYGDTVREGDTATVATNGDAQPTSSTSESDAGTHGDAVDDEAVATTPAMLTFEEAVAKHGRPDYSAILTRRFPGAQWSLNGSRYSGLRWLDASAGPSQADLDALWPAVAEELAAERAAQEAAEAAAAADREAELDARRNDPDVQALLDSFDPRTIWGPDPDYAHILSRRFPGAQWSLNGNDPVNGLVWNSSGPKPTKAQLDAMWADVAREMALEMDPKELARWAGTGDQIYVDGVLRPRGWVGGADDPQPEAMASPDDLQFLPQIPPTNNGSPVDSVNVLKDADDGRNFEQRYGIQLHELGAMIAEAHGYFGGNHGLGLGLNGDRELMWYSDQVDPNIVKEVLRGIGALPEPEPDPEPEVTPATDEEVSEETDEGEE